MIAMSTTTKLAIIFSAIGIAAGIGITLVTVYNQTLVLMFQRLVSENGDNKSVGGLSFAIRENYKARLAVGEVGAFIGNAKGGKVPYTFEWKFSDGLTLMGQNVTRSFDSQGTYYFQVTVTDADGKQVKSTNLSFNVLQEAPKEEGTANATSTH